VALPGVRLVRQQGREIEIVADGNFAQVLEQLRARSIEMLRTEALTLEEIFVSTLQPDGAVA
jgi:hypothetical protein